MRCDLIMPVWNNLRLTADCIDSIRKNTDYPFRLIIIDNASNEETRDYLAGLKSGRIIIIRNGENLGFVKAANQGIKASDAPYLCIINNDVIVTEGWLGEMISVAESAPDIGLVNPSSNNLGQKPGEGEPVELYARKIRKDAGRSMELGSCIGFCMLIKRKVIERTGLFDEVYGMGNFEDTDLSRRAAKEGFRCVRACGAYVYHRENSSFKLVRTFDEDFRRNKEIYEFRWGRPKRLAYVLDKYDGNTLKRLEADSMKLARGGNWVWFFLKDRVSVPVHSNIRAVDVGPKYFYAGVMFNVLKKKKKFDEIFVGNEWLHRMLKQTTFLHKAKINYY